MAGPMFIATIARASQTLNIKRLRAEERKNYISHTTVKPSRDAYLTISSQACMAMV